MVGLLELPLTALVLPLTALVLPLQFDVLGQEITQLALLSSEGLFKLLYLLLVLVGCDARR